MVVCLNELPFKRMNLTNSMAHPCSMLNFFLSQLYQNSSPTFSVETGIKTLACLQLLINRQKIVIYVFIWKVLVIVLAS